jgi:trimeric autotransporter adhesin
LSAKKYPLIPYEKALLGQATGGKFPSVTFLERKKMSTKTSIKRIAAVAAVALTLGGFSAVSAHATIGAVTATVTVAAATGNTATGTIPAAAGTPIVAALGTTTDATAVATSTYTQTFTITDPNGTDVTAAATFVSAATTVTATNTLGAYSVSVPATTVAGTYALGTVTFTPSMGGRYLIKDTVSAVVGDTLTATAIATAATGTVYVGGAGATVGSSGLGTSTIGGVVGGVAKINFGMLTHVGTDQYNLTTSGVGSIQAWAQGTGTVGAPTLSGIAGASDFTTGAKAIAAAATFEAALATVTSTVAGTQTLTWSAINAVTGAPTVVATATITWGAVSSAHVGYTAANSFIADGAVTSTSALQTASVLSYPKAAAATVWATIEIGVKDGSNASLAGVPLSATITGPGLITLTNGTGVGGQGLVRAASLTSAVNTTSAARIGISADGTAGTGVITVSTGTTVLFTKTVTFYGTVATLTATQNLSVASTSGATLGLAAIAPAGLTIATTPAATIVAKDSNGNVVTGLTITLKSTDTSIIASGTILESNGLGAGDGYAGAGYYNASVTSAAGSTSGATTTVVFRTLLSDGVTYISTAPVTFTLGGKASTATYSAALDKSSYAPGEAATLVLTAKDSAGNPIFDQDVTLFAGLGTAPLWSKSVVGITPSTGNIMFKSGKKTITGYAPALEGAFSLTSAIDPLVVTAGGAVTASATATGGESSANASLALDAANAATDAANNAYDEAQNATQAASDALAAVTALSAQVEALIATVKSLAAMVAKIKAKVKA